MSLKCIIMCLCFSLRHICWKRVVLWIKIMYTVVTTYLHNTEKEWQTGIFLSIFIYLSFSKHGVKSDLTIPFFYQTNVLFIYIDAKKMDFCGQLHVIAQCLLRIKSLRKMVLRVVFATINKGRVKTVITVYALVANKVWKWIML